MKTDEIMLEISKLWGMFDKGFKHTNDISLLYAVLDFLTKYPILAEDMKMYRDLLHTVESGGFLLKEEKQFLINYAILIIAEYIDTDKKAIVLSQLRQCSSILDVWPERPGIKIKYESESLREEWLLWFVREYEVLGHLFLKKRGITEYYFGIELARILCQYKCCLDESEYERLTEFFSSVSRSVTNMDAYTNDLKKGIKIVRKLIWKIEQGITRYA